ncbi:DNA primase [Clostridium luticellarii]|uniref:DNA primase n=1 Tax=Clostridium luticellarii TaxID=1691940 RepID=A0A2T0BAW6_9CLOT|nr:DNA primase [Clostridium luticellarii]MCI1944094.1 DNA primase [Clostridium luticellarii]MCI1967264.1 DNA primase [Clostridium luticellarii]MCI1995175.1 DNA primase [Clostridium luticellarii]MCI2039329.1 DNA primase [Clostridium luticellarii]PRR80985.1 DNA primase [Clostridium luticellarii]
MISEDIIQKIKEENDIVDLISESVKLKRTGRNYLGLCPFHHEKTPSFSVSRDKQIYKCFGCGEAGNVFTFVMKSKNLSFPEAVKFLADRVNIDIDFDKDNGRRKNTFQKLYRLNVEAARYFFKCLSVNRKAKEYLSNRGITENIIKKFGLGYSVDSWDHMLNFLKSRGFSELDMVSAGLIIKGKKGNYYDRFRNRIIFPVFNNRGKVIGFGGRVLDNSKPKYLNSPETSLFKKGINLYGLNFAVKNDFGRVLIIVEGYMDCIALHQYGITNAVASLGTALTVNQAKLLARYADKVIISYDADTAGQMATVRGMDILKSVGLEIKVLQIPNGKDPDEFVRNNGREEFLKLVDKALPLIEYRIQNVKKDIDFNNSEGTVKYVEEVLKILSQLDPIERDIYLKRLSEETGIRDQVLYDMLNRSNVQKNVKKDENMNIDTGFGQKLYLEPAYLKAERALLKLMLESDGAFEYSSNQIKVDDIILESHKKIYKYIAENMKYDIEKRKAQVEMKCNDLDTSKEWVEIMDTEIMDDNCDYKSLVDNFADKIKRHRLNESKNYIIKKIKECESGGKLKESLELAQKLMEIQKRIGGMQ